MTDLDQPGFVITAETQVGGIWFLALPHDAGDWLAMVLRHGDGPWGGQYRFRYHVDDRIFGSQDPKSWWRVDAPKHLADPEVVRKHLVRAIAAAAKEMHEAFGTELHHIPGPLSGYEAVDALKKETWCFTKEAP